MRIYQLIHLNQVFTYRKNLVKENSITPSVGKKGRCHNFFFFADFPVSYYKGTERRQSKTDEILTRHFWWYIVHTTELRMLST